MEKATQVIMDDLVYREMKPLDYNVKVKKLNRFAKIPTRGSKAAAGYDLYAVVDDKEPLDPGIEIKPHETVIVGTGLAMELPENTFLGIYPRSGLSIKEGLRPANCVGVIDSDYRGEIKVALHNDTNETKYIALGDRIAQAILHTYIPIEFKEFEELSDTNRGQGGLGSTGK